MTHGSQPDTGRSQSSATASSAVAPALPMDGEAVAQAVHRLRGWLPPTPLVRARTREALLKLESLQHTGSYKVRGALNALLAGLERGDRRPVIAASAGNHAQGLAWAAGKLGVAAWTVVPVGAPATKVDGATALGARVLRHGSCYEEAEVHARALAEQRGFRFLSAFDDPEVIAGQGTLAHEILGARPDVVLAPVGGGGLLAGMALALRHSGVRLVGVQVEGVDALRRALAGEAVLSRTADTVADGVRVRVAGRLTQQLCSRLIDGIVTVSERDVRQAVVDLACGEHLVAEGAGALAFAALARVSGSTPIAVISGGNIDGQRLASLLGSPRDMGDGNGAGALKTPAPSSPNE